MPEALERSTWKEFEELVEKLFRAFTPNSHVKRDDKVRGKNTGSLRQLDVSIRSKVGISDLFIIVECKRHGKKIDSELMASFIGKQEDVGAHLGIIVSERGFTKGARNLAKAKGVQIYTLRDTRKGDWPGNVNAKFFIEAATIHLDHFTLTDLDRDPIVLPDEEQPVRLFDVGNPGQETTPNSIIRKLWTLNGKTTETIDQGFPVKGKSNGGATTDFYLFVKFRVDVKRFARDASLKLLGLVDENGQTHTDSMKVVTNPGKEAVFYSEPDFWKKVKAPFGIVMEMSHVIWPDSRETAATKDHLKITELLASSDLWVAAANAKEPIKLNLD